MNPNGQVTTVLLLAALAAVGCSKSSDTPQAKVPESPGSTLATPAFTSGQRPSVDQKDDEGFGEGAPPLVTGPVSFADGEAAYHAKNYSEAARVFEQYTGQKPDNAWGHFMLGLSAWKAGDLVKAEGAFEHALSIDPDHLKSLVNLSRVLIDQKRFDDALDKLMRAGDLEPDSADVQRLLGRAYHAKGSTADAIDAYRQAIALDEKDAWSMNNLGLLFIEARRFDEAVPLLAKAVELKKDVPVFHNNLGMALEHTGRFKAAATAYSGALAADPGYEKAKQNLARVEAVKSDAEAPFDVEKTATGPVEDTKPPVEDPKVAGDEKTASK